MSDVILSGADIPGSGEPAGSKDPARVYVITGALPGVLTLRGVTSTPACCHRKDTAIGIRFDSVLMPLRGVSTTLRMR